MDQAAAVQKDLVSNMLLVVWWVVVSAMILHAVYQERDEK